MKTAFISIATALSLSASSSALYLTPVSVCNDATYSIIGPVCSGSSDAAPQGVACPMKGARASANCTKHLKSYDEYTQKCLAPENATCEQFSSGVWGCVFPSVGCEATVKPTPAPMQFNVSVCQDATYKVTGPICSGQEQVEGAACPKKGAVASGDCHKYLISYDQYENKCIAPEDAKCEINTHGAWGCVFPTVGCRL